MKTLTAALASASMLALVAPGLASAQDYQSCEDDRQDRQVAGAIIGGILGAVIGNELADDSNNNRRGYDRREHRGRYGYGRRGHGRNAYHHRDRGNAEEVGTIAGAGVGALIGATVAGGEDCQNRAYRGHDNRYPGKPNGTYYEDSRYDDRYYQDDYRYAESDDYGSGQQYDYGSNADLLGGAQPQYGSRAYQTSSQLDYPAQWNCRWQDQRRMAPSGALVTEQVYMCEGADGIWRPRDAYVGN